MAFHRDAHPSPWASFLGLAPSACRDADAQLALAKSEAQRDAQIAQLQQEQGRRERLEAQLLAAAEESAALRSERDTLAAREAWLQDSEARLTQQFDAIGQKLLSDRSETLEKRQQESLGALLGPLREQLTSFRQKVEEVNPAEAKDKARSRRSCGHSSRPPRA